LIRCAKCGYPMADLPDHPCPECGCEETVLDPEPLGHVHLSAYLIVLLAPVGLMNLIAAGVDLWQSHYWGDAMSPMNTALLGFTGLMAIGGCVWARRARSNLVRGQLGVSDRQLRRAGDQPVQPIGVRPGRPRRGRRRRP
jgi:hypothetical protein